jgi:hypothetical protein
MSPIQFKNVALVAEVVLAKMLVLRSGIDVNADVLYLLVG